MTYITNDLVDTLYLNIHNDTTPFYKRIHNTTKSLNPTYIKSYLLNPTY